ncbi:MAG: hypothetical protein GY723_02810, partial [bacterium]|nr:hypothetical protein [bacterium]
MTELALVLSMGGILVLSFLYLRRVERSPVSLYWAASWALLFSAGILSNVAFGQPWTACASTVLGTLFAWCLLAGAIAFANLPIPRWLLPAGACLGLIQSATLFLVGPPAYLLTLPFEIPAIGLAAVLLIRAARQRHTSLPERLLGPTLVVLASIDSVDAIVRSNSADTTPIVVLWLSAMLVVALAQILSVVERARDREQALATELERSRKLETVGRLAGGIAHDFNNELTSILGNASLIRSRVDFDPVLGDAITDLERAAEHCAELTQGLLAFARQVPNHPCSLEVEPVLRKVESTLRPSLPEDVSLDVLVDAGILPLLANATQLHRALTNLVVNARDAVGKTGHIQIRARTRPRVSDTGEESRPEDARDWIEVSIRDDGPGMDEPTRAHAFDPFFTTKPVGQGTG